MFPVVFRRIFSLVFLVLPVTSQVSFGGGLGGGILNSGYLNTGGLIYPNLDGSGPQADSLAAAIYGVAIPPGFNQFSASENFFGRSNHHYPATYGEVKPSDLLIGTGIHINGERLNHGGELDRSYSSYVSDFSPFGLQPSHPGNQRTSNFEDVDPVAARFGVVVPAINHQSTLFHPSLSGSAESFSGNSAGSGEGPTDRFLSSPVETSIRFQLPSQVTLPFNNEIIHNFKPNSNDFEQTRDGDSSPKDNSNTPVSFNPPPSAVDSRKHPLDLIQTAYKFSDKQIAKTEETYQTFEQISTGNIASGTFTPSGDIETETSKAPESSQNEKHKNQDNNRPSSVDPQRSNELKAFDATNSLSPYVYRGHRDREAQQTTAVVSELLPVAEYLSSPRNNHRSDDDGDLKKSPTEFRYAYSFLTQPGYHTDQSI